MSDTGDWKDQYVDPNSVRYAVPRSRTGVYAPYEPPPHQAPRRQPTWQGDWKDRYIGADAPSRNPNLPPEAPRNPDGSVDLSQTEPGLGPGASTGQVMDYIATNYPNMIGFFNSNGEIRKVLTEAAIWGYSEGKMQAKVQATNWYRTTSAAAREFQLLEASDPTEAASRVNATAANIQNVARTMGLGLSGKAIAGMAWSATRNGWNDAQTIDGLMKNLDWEHVQGGSLTDTVDDIKAVAADYLVGVSESTARQYASRIASGELTLEGVRSVMQKQAKARFSWMAPEIDNGVAPVDYFMPVRDTIADTLEVAPESVNMMDPEWLSLLEVRDAESGQMRAATRNEAMLSARRKPGFMNTRGATEMASGLSEIMKEAFGYGG